MKELSLDPADWEKTRKLGYSIVDDVINYLSGIREQKIWNPIPEKVKQKYNTRLPLYGSDIHDVYNEFLEAVYPYPNGNAHPKFWGWVEGSGDIYGAFADFMAKGMNIFGGFGEHSAIYIEKQIIDWLKLIVGYPAESSGILVTGSTLANIVGINVARHAKSPFEDRKEGMNQNSQKLLVYCSTETHNSIQRAVEILGMGSNNIRKIDILENYTIDINKLKKTVKEDKKNGSIPVCIIGTIGTVNTGAIDPIDQLAEICAEENIWLHVDGAFGASLALLPEKKSKLRGLELADSIGFDFHKWLHVPYEAGCVLIKDSKIHEDTYFDEAAYLKKHEKGLSAGPTFFYLGPEMSRSARALKIWFPFKVHGLNKYADLIRQNLKQAEYLSKRIAEFQQLEIISPVTMNIVCFRYKKEGLNEEQLNELNRKIVMEIQERGIAIPSYTVINNKYVIRVAITNHRSRLSDFDDLIDNVINLGRQIISG